MPYKYKGWTFWDEMLDIMGSPPPRGMNVFRAGDVVDAEPAENLPENFIRHDTAGDSAYFERGTPQLLAFKFEPGILKFCMAL